MPITLPPPYVGLTTGLSDQAVQSQGNSVPPGVESVLEYRANFFNVRDWLDTYLVTEIDGLSDADVRDTREVNPSNHGETAFSAYYGGRTITITGKIRAQTLNKLRDLQQGLKQAFNDLEREYPLHFHSRNPENSVVVWCKKSQPLAMKDVQSGPTYTREFLITLRASNPRILSAYTSFLQWNGFVNDSFGTPATVNGTNLLTNPSFERDTLDWNVYAQPGVSGSLSRSVAWSSSGSASGRCQGTLAADTTNYYGGAGINVSPITSGKSYSCSMVTNAVTLPTGAAVSFKFTWLTGGGAFISESYAVNQYGLGVKNQSLTATAPAGAAAMTVYVYCLGNTVNAGAYDFSIDSVMLNEGSTALPYFDGSTSVASTTAGYRWTGIPHRSNSERYSATGISTNWQTSTTTLRSSVTNSGALIAGGVQGQLFMFTGYGYALNDQRVQAKFTAHADQTQVGYATLSMKGKDASNCLSVRVRINGSTSRFEIYKTVNASSTSLFVGSSFTLAANTAYWFRTSIVGNDVSASVFSSDPSVNTSAVALSTSTYTLTGDDITTYGTAVLGYPGLILYPTNFSQDVTMDDWRAEPLGMNGYIIGTATNKGSFPAQPTIQIAGPITSTVITFVDVQENVTIGSIRINGTIPAGDTWTADIEKRTLVDQNKLNKFSSLSIDSDWPELVPGGTSIQVNGSSMDSRTTFAIQWQDTWM